MSFLGSNFDHWLDAQLRDVSLPADLLARLRRTAIAGDDALDAAVADVPLPVGLLDRLQRIGDVPKRRRSIMQMVTAASLFFGIGLSYLGATVGLLLTTAPRDHADRTPLTTHLLVDRGGPCADDDLIVSVEPSGSFWPDYLLATPSPLEVPPIDPFGLTSPVSDRRDGTTEGLIVYGPKQRESLMLDTTPFWWGELGALGNPVVQDDLSDGLERVPGLVPRGIDWPLVSGSNWVFLRQTGIHPPVWPGAHPELQASKVPLAGGTDSYELTRRYVADGELPPRDALRTEEFLAAVDNLLPAPKSEAMGLIVTGGPSPFRGGDLRLLQVGVRAHTRIQEKRPPVHLVVAVDVSASMRLGGRMDTIRGGLAEAIDRLGDNDRFSLIAFGSRARVVAEGAAPDDRAQLLEAVDGLEVESSTNLAAGLQWAYAVAMRQAVSPDTRIRVVVLTDGRTHLDETTEQHVGERLAEAADRDILLEIIDLSEDEGPDRQLAALVRSGGGRIHRATNAEQLRWALDEVLSGRSQRVADDVKLTVTFDPKVVAAYRLFGHEAKPVDGLVPARLEADFHSGQSAMVLYEVQLKQGGGTAVAEVELVWHEPNSQGPSSQGRQHRLVRTIRRKQFASSWEKTPIWLQAATVAAEAVEVLRESPFARIPPQGPPLASVLELARYVDARLYENPDFAAFVSVLERAEKAKPYRKRGWR